MRELTSSLDPSVTSSRSADIVPVKGIRNLSGFAKVLAGGRVIKLNRNKPFMEKFIGCNENQLCGKSPQPESIDQVILETVVTNLEAGVQLIEKQEHALAKFGGRLSEVALALNHSLEKPSESSLAQVQFEESRGVLRELSKETFDHTSLFSNGPSKPITLALPMKRCWEGISIDRLDISKPGLLAIDKGKVCPNAAGFLLDRDSVQSAFDEWRSMCVHNHMQGALLLNKLKLLMGKLKDLIGGKRWVPPPTPDRSSSGPLYRSSSDN